MLTKGILSILSLLGYFKSHPWFFFYTCLLNIYWPKHQSLIRPLFCTKSFNVFPFHSGKNLRVFTMNYKALHNLHLYLSSCPEPHFTLSFSSISYQAPGTEISLLFLQFILHIVALALLQRLLPLPGMIFFQISLWLTP